MNRDILREELRIALSSSKQLNETLEKDADNAIGNSSQQIAIRSKPLHTVTTIAESMVEKYDKHSNERPAENQGPSSDSDAGWNEEKAGADWSHFPHPRSERRRYKKKVIITGTSNDAMRLFQKSAAEFSNCSRAATCGSESSLSTTPDSPLM